MFLRSESSWASERETHNGIVTVLVLGQIEVMLHRPEDGAMSQTQFHKKHGKK